jgi:hypothetical protein
VSQWVISFWKEHGCWVLELVLSAWTSPEEWATTQYSWWLWQNMPTTVPSWVMYGPWLSDFFWPQLRLGPLGVDMLTSWGCFGYHVTSFYAPASRSGTPEELPFCTTAGIEISQKWWRDNIPDLHFIVKTKVLVQDFP